MDAAWLDPTPRRRDRLPAIGPRVGPKLVSTDATDTQFSASGDEQPRLIPAATTVTSSLAVGGQGFESPQLRQYWAGRWSRLGESNPGPTHYECHGHRPASAHPVHVGTPAPPSRHSVHTWRYRCLSFRPRVRPRRRSLTPSWTPSQSRSESTRGLESRTAQVTAGRGTPTGLPAAADSVVLTDKTVSNGSIGQHFVDRFVDTPSTVDSWAGC